MKTSGFKNCLIDIDRETEFSGDDVDQYSKLVDLEASYDKLVIIAPAIDSATISIYVQEGEDEDTVPVPVHHGQVVGATPAWATAVWATTASTGSLTITCPYLGGFRYIRLKSSANQTADVTFRVAGRN